MFDFRILDTYVPIATWPDLEHSHCTHKCPGAPFRPQVFPFRKQSGRPTSYHQYSNLRYRIYHLPHCPSWHLSGHERQFCLQLPGIPHSRPPHRLPCSVSGWFGTRMDDIARFSPRPVNPSCAVSTTQGQIGLGVSPLALPAASVSEALHLGGDTLPLLTLPSSPRQYPSPSSLLLWVNASPPPWVSPSSLALSTQQMLVKAGVGTDWQWLLSLFASL